eukprot:6671935-Prymnesium_polylepis.1
MVWAAVVGARLRLSQTQKGVADRGRAAWSQRRGSTEGLDSRTCQSDDSSGARSTHRGQTHGQAAA